jgi:hypothetical protein
VKIFRRMLVGYWILFLAATGFVVMPPYPPSGHIGGIKHFLARSLLFLTGPLALGTITYAIVQRYRAGMARPSTSTKPKETS